jgi:putative nucleotidyltransferase with HDIG domain
VYPPSFTRGSTSIPFAIDRAFTAKAERLELEMPVLPEASATILSETSKADWSAAKIVDALKRDAALAAHLLRIANSPAFCGSSPVVSIQQAVTRLGASHLRQLAVVIACETRAFEAPGFELEVRAVFRHSLAVALCAREIARQRRANVEAAFLAGLLHDLGWPVVIQGLSQLARSSTPLPRDAVFERAEQLHAALGGAVARSWKLPEAVALAIVSHHEAAPADPLSATVALADALAQHAAGAPWPEEKLMALPATRSLNLYPDVIESLSKKSPEFWAEAAQW